MTDAPVPVAPPTTPGQLRRPDRPRVWPLALGIITIVIGTLGGLNYGSNAIAAPFTAAFMDQAIASSGQRNAVLESTRDAVGAYQTINVIGQAVGLVLSIALVIAGIGLCMRRRWAVRILLVWSPVKLVHALAVGLITYLTMSIQFGAIVEAEPNVPPAAATAFQVGAGVMGVVVTIAVMIMPIFYLVWFRRAAVCREVAAWVTPAASP